MSEIGLAAIVIAGGRGSRMGGIDKPGLLIAGATLRARVLGAARTAGLEPVIHVGPEVGGGPAAAMHAGLARIGSAAEEVVVLAGDLVRPDLVLAALAGGGGGARADGAGADSAGAGGAGIGGAGTDGSGADGTVLVDPDGREQWLAGRYRVTALRAAIAALPDGPENAPLRAIMRGLDLVEVSVSAEVIADVDTWQDYDAARGR